ncbi:polyphosphate polymerase domain-containing protein [Streptococcus caprae]|uniref:Polyphosphate polymerase domain-containing protein n=1 Tax=Streptococcus caprae TaxID=1640501 RepID=A0ABV8CZ23_9STRE
MTKVQKKFKRKETKYIVDKETFALFAEDLKSYMVADDFATSTITNIYFDNANFDMIQDSLAKKNGREKIRMRVYDSQPSDQSEAFLEIKKKEEGIGYKFRLTSTPESVMNYMLNDEADSTIIDAKVLEEMEDLRQRYGTIVPMMYIYYDRVSFKGIEDKKIRLTIDQNLLYRDYAVDVNEGKFGRDLLDPSKVIMEIKVPGELPTWLAELLDKYGIEKQSFSKYGNAYKLSHNLIGG